MTAQPAVDRGGRVAWRYLSARSLFDCATGPGDGSQHVKTRFPERPLYLMRGRAHDNVTLISRHSA